MKLKYIAAIGALFFATSAFADCAEDCPEGGCKKDKTVSLALLTSATEAPEEEKKEDEIKDEKEKKDPPKGPT